jgi:hypothetical protein
MLHGVLHIDELKTCDGHESCAFRTAICRKYFRRSEIPAISTTPISVEQGTVIAISTRTGQSEPQNQPIYILPIHHEISRLRSSVVQTYMQVLVAGLYRVGNRVEAYQLRAPS